ncbi:unnamed protein product [Blepharisma stoltei]|uniref:MARVEL domain-containing protein n=1 Tax=Blepharisma stoltei TaxID=1481888 RepID=A0AAU9JVV0_9CILI|nr:unnamed protein product [Blepharisma stoltei]
MRNLRFSSKLLLPAATVIICTLTLPYAALGYKGDTKWVDWVRIFIFIFGLLSGALYTIYTAVLKLKHFKIPSILSFIVTGILSLFYIIFDSAKSSLKLCSWRDEYCMQSLSSTCKNADTKDLYASFLYITGLFLSLTINTIAVSNFFRQRQKLSSVACERVNETQEDSTTSIAEQKTIKKFFAGNNQETLTINDTIVLDNSVNAADDKKVYENVNAQHRTAKLSFKKIAFDKGLKIKSANIVIGV